MKYIMNKYCRGTFTLLKTIDLNEFLNQDEQKNLLNLNQQMKKK